MAKKALLTTRNQIEGVKIVEQFTKFVLALTVVCLTTRTLDMFSGIVTRISLINVIEFTQEQNVEKILFKQVALFGLFSSHAFEGLIYFRMDKNIKELMLEMIHLRNIKIELLFYRE